jgi:FAD/FMN-containing dehydrogenase
MSRKRLRFRFWAGVAGIALLIVIGCLSSKPASVVSKAWLNDRPANEVLPPGFIDDASRLNRTHVVEVCAIETDRAAAEAQIRDLIVRARKEKLGIAIAGARHSMGGHVISPEGIVLDMLPFNHLELDAEKRILRVGAGARWAEVVPYLDQLGYSVAVMQASNDFSVGGSLSVNCHGWQQNAPPIASTVEVIRLVTPAGQAVRCSRSENPELFSLVLGGYGLLGVILEVDLRVVPNERYRPEVEVLPADNYVARFAAKTKGSADIGMAYGRLCVVPGENTFLREAILTVFRRIPCKREEIPPLGATRFRTLHREIYRAQIDSAAGKDVRWKAEKSFGEQFGRSDVSRNQLLNEAAGLYQEKNADRTDILHEYFIRPQEVSRFLERAREIIPRHEGDLLNVTIRNVREDRDSVLRYADGEMFAFVMLFSQRRTEDADRKMEAMTRELIDASLACGGRYYLCYRPHATREQFARAYPQAAEFFDRKRHYDPDEVFRNKFYDQYGRQ